MGDFGFSFAEVFAGGVEGGLGHGGGIEVLGGLV